jgi:reactive intermediate/imine deaminase
MTPAKREEFLIPDLAEPVSHYVHAVALGDLVFISGCTGADASGELVGGDDVELQAEQVLRNLDHALQTAGSSLQDVVKVTVYLTDIDDRQRVNTARQAFFGDTRPASTLVEVTGLVGGAKVEIDAIARRSAGAEDAPDMV